MKGLVEINELKVLLGYEDMRSVRTWLKKNHVPLVVLGRKTYTHRQFLDNLIAGTLGSNANREIVPGYISKSGETGAISPTKTEPVVPKRTVTRNGKNSPSNAATRLLKNIKLG